MKVLYKSHFLRVLPWPSWLVRRTYKQYNGICEGRGFEPHREHFLQLSRILSEELHLRS